MATTHKTRRVRQANSPPLSSAVMLLSTALRRTLDRIKQAAEPNVESPFNLWAAQNGFDLDGQEIVPRLRQCIQDRQARADAAVKGGTKEHFSYTMLLAAAYELFEASPEPNERAVISMFFLSAVGAERHRTGPNLYLHACLRAVVTYGRSGNVASRAASQFWHRDGLIIRYLKRTGIRPTEVTKLAQSPGENLTAWYHRQVEFEKHGGKHGGSGTEVSVSPSGGTGEPRKAKTIRVTLSEIDGDGQTAINFKEFEIHTSMERQAFTRVFDAQFNGLQIMLDEFER